MSLAERAVPEGGARQVATAWSVRPGWVVLAVVGVVSIAVGDIPLTAQYVPLVASVVVLGLPHGAVDHLVVPRQRDEPLTARWLGIVVGVYLLLGTAYAVVWFLRPIPAFLFFVLLTLFHWGQGELYPLVELLGAEYLRAPGGRALTILVRGGAPMLVPLVAFPDQYEFVAGTLVGLFDPAAAEALDPLFGPRSRLLVAAGYATVLVATLGLGFVRTDAIGPWVVDAGELLLLTAFFLVVPPVLAIGVYFSVWHSLRHVSRTVLLDERSVRALDRGRIRPVVRRFARDAAPMTAGALVLLGGFSLLVPAGLSGVPDLVALYLVVIAVLTLPHVAIVTWLDRAQHVL